MENMLSYILAEYSMQCSIPGIARSPWRRSNTLLRKEMQLFVFVRPIAHAV